MSIAKRQRESDSMELSGKEMEAVSGGFIFTTHGDYDIIDVYEIIDDKTGNVLRRTTDWDEAIQYAADCGVSSEEISWGEVAKLRGI